MAQPTGRLARWQVQLQQYDFTLIHRKGKEHVVPDMLSRAVPKVDILSPGSPLVVTDKWYLKMVERVKKSPLKFPSWREDNGRLYKHIKGTYSELSPEVDKWKEVVPKEDRRRIIAEVHEPPTCGHMGVYKTFMRASERFYWPKMRNDIANYISRCVICLRHKTEIGAPKAKMISHTKPQRPWEVVSTDLIGPLPRSKHGHSFLLVVTDYLSKFVLLHPLRKATSEAVTRFMEGHVFLLFGVPSTILCDNGPQYRGSPFRKLAENYKVRLKFNANYHPRANPTERTNRTIKTMLSMYLSDNHRDWDVNLDKIGCAIRTSCHETTKLSPYFINFGRRMLLSGTEHAKVVPQVDQQSEYDSQHRSVMLAKVFEDVRQRLQIAGEKSAERYNLRCRQVEYLPNQLVYRKNYSLSDASKYYARKLAPEYLGPYIVHKRLSPWTYELKDENGKHCGVWHIKDLKDSPDME